MNPQSAPDADRQRPRLPEMGAVVLQAGIAGSLTSVVAHPLSGLIVGLGTGVLDVVVSAVASELSKRQLSPRESSRVSKAAICAIRKRCENDERGFHLRNDEFFTTAPEERSPAEEITEAVFLAIQREVQERKIPFESYLLVNIAYQPGVTVDAAYRLVRLAADLSYAQLCVLAALSEQRTWKLRSHALGGAIANSTLADVHDLAFRGLLIPAGATERYGGPFMSEVFVSPVGADLIEHAELARLPNPDLANAQAALALLARADETHST